MRIAAARSTEAVAAPPAPEPVLDVPAPADEEAAAEARRAERRRARAEARAAAPEAAAAVAEPRRAAATAPAGDLPPGDGRVVTIRANRATPPSSDGDVVLPAERPSLRPAQPATQPRRRRFARTGR